MTNEQAGDSFSLALRRARAEFLEMPGLQLTVAQAARLWHFDSALCSAVLTELVVRGQDSVRPKRLHERLERILHRALVNVMQHRSHRHLSGAARDASASRAADQESGYEARLGSDGSSHARAK